MGVVPHRVRRRHLAELERPSNALVELTQTPRWNGNWSNGRDCCRGGHGVPPALPAAPDPTVPVETALALLASAVGESRDFGARREALRALALANRWDAVDDSLARHELKPTISTALAAAGRSGAEPGTSNAGVADAGWRLRRRRRCGFPSPDRLDPESRSKLEQAGSHYRSALALAEAEDERLETQVLGATVRNRLRRLETIALVLPHH